MPGTQRLDAAVRERFTLSWARARERIERGKIWIDGTQILDIGHALAPGVEFEFVENARLERAKFGLLPPEAIRYIDADIIVVDKPAGLLSVPYRPEDFGTLDQILAVMLAQREGVKRGTPKATVHVVHRLDKGTSGVLVFARTRAALNHLKDQFRVHSAHRRYLALAEGHLSAQTVTSHLVSDRGDGLRGSVEHASHRAKKKLSRGRIAITHVEVVERLARATLLGCRLETGRTNQIRIHLAELGHPVVGEMVYRRDFGPAPTQASRLCLHAGELGIIHPRTGEPLVVRSEVPRAMQREIDSRR